MPLAVSKDAKDAKEFKFDPNPMYAFDTVWDEERNIGIIVHWMSFDPKYGPESEKQIEWHAKRGTDTRGWEVGKPCPNFK